MSRRQDPVRIRRSERSYNDAPGCKFRSERVGGTGRYDGPPGHERTLSGGVEADAPRHCESHDGEMQCAEIAAWSGGPSAFIIDFPESVTLNASSRSPLKKCAIEVIQRGQDLKRRLQPSNHRPMHISDCV